MQTTSSKSQSYPVAISVLGCNSRIALQNTLYFGQLEGSTNMAKAVGGWSLQNSAAISRLATTRPSGLVFNVTTLSLQASQVAILPLAVFGR